MDTVKEWKTFSTKRSMVISGAWVMVCACVHECVCANTKGYDTIERGVWSDDRWGPPPSCSGAAIGRKTNGIGNEKKVNFSLFVCVWVCVCELGVEVCDRSPKTTRQWPTQPLWNALRKSSQAIRPALKYLRNEKTYFYAPLQTDQTEVVNKSPSATELAFSCKKWGLWCWSCVLS